MPTPERRPSGICFATVPESLLTRTDRCSLAPIIARFPACSRLPAVLPAGSRFGIQHTTALCGVSISFAVTQGKFTGEYVASLV